MKNDDFTQFVICQMSVTCSWDHEVLAFGGERITIVHHSGIVICEIPEFAKKVELLARTNLFGFIGRDPTTVFLYDLIRYKRVGELRFAKPVDSFRFRRDALAIRTSQKLWIYKFPSLALLHVFGLAPNPGILTLSTVQHAAVIVFPGLQPNILRIEQLTEKQTLLLSLKWKPHLIQLSQTGEYLAVCNSSGHEVSIYRIAADVQQWCVFYRGFTPATILNMDFNNSTTKFLMSSDNGTLHIFDMPTKATKTRISRIRKIGSLQLSAFGFFTSEDSVLAVENRLVRVA